MRIFHLTVASLLLVPVVAFAATVMPFNDVPPDAYYYQPVLKALELGVVEEREGELIMVNNKTLELGHNWKPGAPLTRASFVIYMIKTINAGLVTPETPSFSDVPKSDDYGMYPYIETATKLGLVSGTRTADGKSTGKFEPNKLVNRAEAAVIIMKAFTQVQASSTVSFPDLKNTPWAVNAIKKAATAGFFRGYPDKTFGPGNTINKAEGITVLMQVRKKLDTKELTLSFAQSENTSSSTKIYTKAELLAKIALALPGYTAVNLKQTGSNVVFFATNNAASDTTFAWYKLSLVTTSATPTQLYGSKSFLNIARGAISPDGKEFFYIDEEGRMWSVDIATEAKKQYGGFSWGKVSLHIAPVYTPDGKYILYLNQFAQALLVTNAKTKVYDGTTAVKGFWMSETGDKLGSDDYNSAVQRLQDTKWTLESGKEYPQYTFLSNNRVQFSNKAILNLSTMMKE